MGIFSHRQFRSFPQGKQAATESCYPILINYKVHAGSFHVSVIHRTMTWTAGCLTCVHDNSYGSYVCVYTQGWAYQQRVSTTFWLGKTLTNLSCAPEGVRTFSLLLWCSTNFSHPTTVDLILESSLYLKQKQFWAVGVGQPSGGPSDFSSLLCV